MSTYILFSNRASKSQQSSSSIKCHQPQPPHPPQCLKHHQVLLSLLCCCNDACAALRVLMRCVPCVALRPVRCVALRPVRCCSFALCGGMSSSTHLHHIHLIITFSTLTTCIYHNIEYCPKQNLIFIAQKISTTAQHISVIYLCIYQLTTCFKMSLYILLNT